jgi:hypothetical protein
LFGFFVCDIVSEGVATRFPPQADVVFTVSSGNREKIMFIL